MKGLLYAFLFLSISVVSLAQLTGVHSYTIDAEGSAPQIQVLRKSISSVLLLGTTNGLYSFDGNIFTPIPNDKALKSASVTAVGEDAKGKIWVGFQTGEIGTVEKSKVYPLKAEEGHPAVSISTIISDSKGVIYFGTAGEGVYYYANRRFYNVNTDDGLTDNYIYELTIDGADIIACTDRGVNLISINSNHKQVKGFTSANGLPDNIVRCITKVPAPVGQYWIGMQDRGVGQIGFSGNKPYFYPNWNFGQVNSLLRTDNQLWVATQEKGILNFDMKTASPEQKPLTTDASGFIKTANLLQDDEGNVWFSSGSQLVKTNGARLQNIIPLPQEVYKQVHTLLVDRKGDVWINQNEGLARYRKTESGKWDYKDFKLEQINSKTDMTCLFEDASGFIWAGTLGKGIIIVDPTSGYTKNILEDRLLVEGSILSITGSGNDIWLSSLGGTVHCSYTPAVSLRDYKYKFENFNDRNGIGSNYIYSVFIDSKNRVWFGTDGKGLTYYSNGRFFNFNKVSKLKDLVIYNICEDKSGNIWFSALNNGLFKYDGKSFTNISTPDGLSDNTVTSLACDSRNNIVAVTKRGVNIIDAAKGYVTYLDRNQGIEEVNSDLNCISQAGDAVYLVTSTGIMRYIPTQNTLLPNLVLSSVQLFLDQVDVQEKKKFAYDENNLTFSFRGISYSHPDKIRYRYKVDGLSNEWITTKDNNINIPKFPPGNYVFRVRASINNSFKNTKEVAYSFVVAKPFWFQWWFLLLSLILIVSAVYFYVKSREKAVKRWERLEKEKVQSQFETLKSQVNPHFLFNSFNTLISVIEDDRDKAVEYVEHLSDLYRKIVTYRDKDVITLKEEIDIIEDYFFIQKKRFGDNLKFENRVSKADQSNCYIAPLTLQLLTENAVKHNAVSTATPLMIELFTEDGVLFVRNNINPKITTEKGAGMGLQNIQKRYKLLSSEEIVISAANGYFTVSIPLLKKPV